MFGPCGDRVHSTGYLRDVSINCQYRVGEQNTLDGGRDRGGQENMGVSGFSLILQISLSPGPVPGCL